MFRLGRVTDWSWFVSLSWFWSFEYCRTYCWSDRLATWLVPLLCIVSLLNGLIHGSYWTVPFIIFGVVTEKLLNLEQCRPLLDYTIMLIYADHGLNLFQRQTQLLLESWRIISVFRVYLSQNQPTVTKTCHTVLKETGCGVANVDLGVPWWSRGGNQGYLPDAVTVSDGGMSLTLVESVHYSNSSYWTDYQTISLPLFFIQNQRMISMTSLNNNYLLLYVDEDSIAGKVILYRLVPFFLILRIAALRLLQSVYIV